MPDTLSSVSSRDESLIGRDGRARTAHVTPSPDRARAELGSGLVNTESTVPRRSTVGVPRESAAGERRVALVPKVVEKLRSRGVDVVIEAGAGLGALIPDELFTDAAAT